MNVRIVGIKVCKELLGVFCLMNKKGIIHVPAPDPGWVGEVLMGLASKSSIKQAGHYRADRISHSSPLYLFIILTSKCEECDFKAELKEDDYVLDRKEGPIVE